MAFYLTLPSNSSAKYFPHNHAGHFITQLPEQIDLNGEWEVGLAEIQFSTKYTNVSSEGLWLKYTTPDIRSSKARLPRIDPTESHSGSVKFTPATEIRIKIPGGLYTSNEKFVAELERVIALKNLYPGDSASHKRKTKPLRFGYNPITKKIRLVIQEPGAKVHLSDLLRRILGASQSEYYGRGAFSLMYMMDLNQSFKSIFVYCDLAIPRPVGDIMAPLLRTMPTTTPNADTEFYHQIYVKPHYIPLSRTQFSSIELVLSTDAGSTLSFSSGHTVATLHLRPRRPLFS